MRLPPELLKELELSAIAPDIAKLNFQSLTPEECWEYLLYALDDRRNDGRLRDKWLSRYAHLDGGGWWCGGIDILTGQDSLWGCLKPVTPKLDSVKGKVIKYEHPPKVATEIFCLRVTRHIWRLIARRHDVELPDLDAIPNEDISKTFWEWVQLTPAVSIVITEGAKKAASLLSAGFCAIALPGVFNGYRTPKNEQGEKIGLPTLIPQMTAIAQKGREIIWAFDNDTKPETVKNVRAAITQTAKLFEYKGCKNSVMVWGITHPEVKGIDDLHAAYGAAHLDEIYSRRLSLQAWQEAIALDITPYVSLTVNERYLQSHNPDPTAQIIGLKSAKGSGKSTWLVERVRENRRVDRKTLVLTHRIQLGRALAKAFGLPYLDELKDDATGGIFGFILCADSLHAKSVARFNPEDWEGADIIIDECEQVIWHIFESSTEISRHRVEVIKNLQLTLQNAVRGGGKIYLSDADLSPIAINFVRGVLGYDAPVWCLENRWKATAKRLIHYDQNSPKKLVAALHGAIAKNERVLLHVTGQKAKSKYGTQSLESMLLKSFPDKAILRIDGESVADPNHPAYGIMDQLDDTLKGFDIVIASPTIETGVSIDLKGHFDSVWGIFSGLQTVDAVAQTLERLRENVPRHVWFSRNGLCRVGKGATSTKSLLYCTHERVKRQLEILTKAGIATDIDCEGNQAALLAWARRGAMINQTVRRYRDACLEKLLSEGYSLDNATDIDDGLSEAIEGELEVCRDENYGAELEGIAAAITLDNTEAESLQKKRSLTKGERYQLRKHQLTRSYGVEVTPALVQLDDDGGYRKLQLHYFLTLGNDYAALRFGKKLQGLSDDGGGIAFKPDADKKLSMLTYIKAFTALDMVQFLDPEKEWHNQNLQAWFERVQAARPNIKKYLGIQISSTAIATANQCLDLIGRKLEQVSRRRIDGKITKTYRIAPPPKIYSDIFQFWQDENDEIFTAPSVEGVTSNPIEDISKSSEVTAETMMNPAPVQLTIPSSAPMATAIASVYTLGQRAWFYSVIAANWLQGKVDQVLEGRVTEYHLTANNGTGQWISDLRYLAPV